jgi:hypothetical protein
MLQSAINQIEKDIINNIDKNNKYAAKSEEMCFQKVKHQA